MDKEKIIDHDNLLLEKQGSRRHHPWKTIAIYVVFGVLWILFSDNILNLIVNDKELYIAHQSYKGVFYVVSTAFILYFLIELDYKKIIKLTETVTIKNQDLVSFSEELIAMEEELNEKIQTLHLTMDDLNEQKQFVDEVINSSNTAIMVWNLKGEVLDVNNHFFELFGYDEVDIIGHKWYDVILPKEERVIIAELINDLKNSYSVKNFENKVITKEGIILDMMWNDTVIQEPKSKSVRVVSFGVDITHKKANEEKIFELAFKDKLTGFDNRASFEQKIEELIDMEKPFTLYYLDIDNFRKINDIHGHRYGDLFIKDFSTKLMNNLIDCHLFRWCGDEFMILDTLVDDDLLKKRIETLNSAVSIKWEYDHIEYHPSASIGIAKFPADGKTKEEILMNIDVALHYSKETGKSKISMYDPSFQKDIETKMAIENLIYTSLLNDQFKLVIQPIFDLKSNLIAGGEVLLRLKDKEASINLGELIKVAEETGQILKIDQWVIRNTFDLLSKELKNKNVVVSINLSAKTISSADTMDFLNSCIKEYKIDPSCVEFEITEHSLIDDIEESIHLVTTLKDMGFKLALDDFGTRYSSLNYLSYMPFDSLKIDKSYVDKIDSVGNGTLIVDQIVKLSNALGIKTIAEGIETINQYEELSRIECDFGQGFYLERPIETSVFINLIDQQSNEFEKINE